MGSRVVGKSPSRWEPSLSISRDQKHLFGSLLRGRVVLLFWASGCGARTDLGLPSSLSGGENTETPDTSAPPPSCTPGGPGLTDCGPGSENCCISLEVPGGTFFRTYVNMGDGPTGEADPATVSGFRLDRYLVTVGRFRQFVKAWKNGYLPASGAGTHAYLNCGLGLANAANPGGYETGWVTSDDDNVEPTDENLTLGCDGQEHLNADWTAAAGANERLPINCVNWYEAYAFCIWDGGFLPSEAEWAFVAAGGSQQREYPWGSANPGTGSQYAIYDCDYPNGNGVCSGLVAGIAPVGTATLGVALWGQLDMAGDLAEWTLDWIDDPLSGPPPGTPSPEAFYPDPCTDCAFLTETDNQNPDRVTRGANYGDDYIFSFSRYFVAPTKRVPYDGFRCARAP
jgi:sulfatase modifying factor 1